MSIKSNIPQIMALRGAVEERFGRSLNVHADFLELVSSIEDTLREHISESTLERVWGYSTRGYKSVSLRTLNVLSLYASGCEWHTFCNSLSEELGIDSEMFHENTILTSDLNAGDRLRIGWLPDRVCTLRYLGDSTFVAEECENSTMRAGDEFKCLLFRLGREACMTNFVHSQTGVCESIYVVGRRHGLTLLERLG